MLAEPQFSSLPLLLESRRSGRLCNPRNMKQWENEMLFNFTKKPKDPKVGRRQFRNYAQRSIPFTALGTPHSEAVLAMDRQSSYVLCLGAKDETHASPGLALRFYGVPSPATIAKRGKAPMLQCIPLLHGIGDLTGEQGPAGAVVEETIFNGHGNVSPVSTPVTMLIAKDWNMGVALVRRRSIHGGTNDSQTDNTGVAVLFTLPRRNSPTTTVFTCRNIEIASQARNLLWMVDVVAKQNHNGDNSFVPRSVPGYLFCNDEGDGLRLTWSASQSFLSDTTRSTSTAPAIRPLKNAVSPASAILTLQNSWEKSVCDSTTGNLLPSSEGLSNDHDQICVVSEAYLHVDMLLAEILSKRKGISEKHPEFYFSLISLHNSGRIAKLAIVFNRKKKACSIGLFVNVDIIQGVFEELDWVQGPSKDSTALRAWCHTLGINRRMKQLRAGPYAVSPNQTVDWSRLVKERRGFDCDEEDDYDVAYWKDFVAGSKAKSLKPRSVPKLISMASLYKDCDIVSNEALLKCDPVLSMHARESPTQLRYG
ncbi:MAG: hypothetical protein SGILL_003112 [Bacillariaceae sp.]